MLNCAKYFYRPAFMIDNNVVNLKYGEFSYVDDSMGCACESIQTHFQNSLQKIEDSDICEIVKCFATYGDVSYVVGDLRISFIQLHDKCIITFATSTDPMFANIGVILNLRTGDVYGRGDYSTLRLLMTLTHVWLTDLSTVQLTRYCDVMLFLNRKYMMETTYSTYSIEYDKFGEPTVPCFDVDCPEFVSYVCKLYLQREADRCKKISRVNYTLTEEALLKIKKDVLQYPNIGVLPLAKDGDNRACVYDRYIRVEYKGEPLFVLYNNSITSTWLFSTKPVDERRHLAFVQRKEK